MSGFPRESRLRGGALYLRLFRTGQRFRTRHFNIFFAANTADTARLGIAVSKRFVSRAVDRNRIKRIVRESFRLHSQQLNSTDIIVQVNSSAVEASSSQLFEALANAWRSVAQPVDQTTGPR